MNVIRGVLVKILSKPTKFFGLKKLLNVFHPPASKFSSTRRKKKHRPERNLEIGLSSCQSTIFQTLPLPLFLLWGREANLILEANLGEKESRALPRWLTRTCLHVSPRKNEATGVLLRENKKLDELMPQNERGKRIPLFDLCIKKQLVWMTRPRSRGMSQFTGTNTNANECSAHIRNWVVDIRTAQTNARNQAAIGSE